MKFQQYQILFHIFALKFCCAGAFGGVEDSVATNFASTVLLALEHMHGLGYAYRDLKPENLLISSNGYLK